METGLGLKMKVQGKCNCFYCGDQKPHPEERKYHQTYRFIGGTPKFDNALKDEDHTYYEACSTCGHVRECESKQSKT